MSPNPTLPHSGGFLEAVRESSRSIRVKSGILITPERLDRLIESPAFVTSFRRVSSLHGLAMPLNFELPLAELNLISILSLLNFASGYRAPLHAETGRGAWDNIRAFVFGLYLTSSGGDEDWMSARGLSRIQATLVSELLRVNIHVERPHPDIPGLIVGETGGPLYPLVKQITSVLNETGNILVETGYPDLGTFVAEALKAGAAARTEVKPGADVEVILERLVKAFPGFQDMALINNQPVYCFKKALFLIHAIYVRFRVINTTNTAPFPIPNTSHIPVFTDNVLPSLLVHLGVIDLSEASSLNHIFADAGSSHSIETLLSEPPADNAVAASLGADKGKKEPPVEGPRLTVAESYILRAAAIDACELLHERLVAKGVDITIPEIDMWIWSVAKDRPDYRKLPRFVLQDTVFF